MNKIDPATKHVTQAAPVHGSMAKDAECFRKAGFSQKAADAIVRIDTTMAGIRRAMIRRETVIGILAELDPALDLARFDTVAAVMHWVRGGAESDEEVTVGTVADRLGVDPSRASRLVAEVVELGYIRRTASQTDSRRTVLVPTEKAVAFANEFRARKTSMLGRSLRGWTEQELVIFAELVDRFSTWGRAETRQDDKSAGTKPAAG